MTSEAKVTANKRNAAKSTGPRTLAGKRRSSRNAIRHGLAMSIRNDPSVSQQIDELAHAMTKGCSEQGDHATAQHAAEAQLQIIRVKEKRKRLLEQASSGAPDSDRYLLFTSQAPLLASLDRYETRALSQRKGALRKLRQGWTSHDERDATPSGNIYSAS